MESAEAPEFQQLHHIHRTACSFKKAQLLRQIDSLMKISRQQTRWLPILNQPTCFRENQSASRSNCQFQLLSPSQHGLTDILIQAQVSRETQTIAQLNRRTNCSESWCWEGRESTEVCRDDRSWDFAIWRQYEQLAKLATLDKEILFWIGANVQNEDMEEKYFLMRLF